MRKFIGIKPRLFHHFNELKKELLLFDHIFVNSNFPEDIKFFKETKAWDKNKTNEIEWLYENDLIIDVNNIISPENSEPKYFKLSLGEESNLNLIRNFVSEDTLYEGSILGELKDKILSLRGEKDIKEQFKLLYFQYSITDIVESYYARIDSCLLSSNSINIKAVPILDPINVFRIVKNNTIGYSIKTPLVCFYFTVEPPSDEIKKFSNFARTSETDVIHIVFKSFPIPDALTPWQHILEYKSESESNLKLLALRRWMNKIAVQSLPANEIEEELDFLLTSYQKYMELHKLKTQKGFLEVLILSSTEFIENLVKLKFSKMAQRFFSIKKRKFSLMEAEMIAPGNEIAYVVKTKERFAKGA